MVSILFFFLCSVFVLSPLVVERKTLAGVARGARESRVGLLALFSCVVWFHFGQGSALSFSGGRCCVISRS